MDNPFESFNKIDWRTFNTQIVLKNFRNYSKEIESLVSREAIIEELLHGPNWRPKPESRDEISEYFEEKRVARYLHDEVIPPLFRYSTVVLLFLLLERELMRWSSEAAKQAAKIPLETNKTLGSLLEPFACHSEKVYGIIVRNDPDFPFLETLLILRNCVVHAAGDITRAKPRDRPRLRQFVISTAGLSEDDGSIDIQQEFIELATDKVEAFFQRLAVKFDWKWN